MYAMPLDMTLYACGAGRLQGRHLKIQQYHFCRQYEYKVFESSPIWIKIFELWPIWIKISDL